MVKLIRHLNIEDCLAASMLKPASANREWGRQRDSRMNPKGRRELGLFFFPCEEGEGLDGLCLAVSLKAASRQHMQREGAQSPLYEESG